MRTPDGRDGPLSERQQILARQFLSARPRLISVAYTILGSHGEAEDVVSAAWLRLSSADAVEPIRDVEAWSLVAVARAAVDEYRSARRRRERYVGPWLPEPMLGVSPPADPADRATVDDSGRSTAQIEWLDSCSEQHPRSERATRSG